MNTTRERKERILTHLADALDSAIDEGISEAEVDRHVRDLLHALDYTFSAEDSRSLSLEMKSSLFYHEDERLTEVSIRGRRQIEALRALGAGGLGFEAGVAEADLRQLLLLSIQARGKILELPEAQRLLRSRGVTKVHLLSPRDLYEWAPLGSGPGVQIFKDAGFNLAEAAPVYTSMADLIANASQRAATGASIDMNAARSVGEKLARTLRRSSSDLMQLGERPDFDQFTVQHSLRVALMATYVGAYLGARQETLTEIAAAGLMHDVGKGRIPREVLMKPGRLDPDERRIIQQHPLLGTEVLLDSPDVSPSALGAAFGHHLRHDGKGYPNTRPWAESSKITSLVQVCDVFEALTARRPYKEPYTPARAYKILYSDQGAFDPAILAAFTRAMGLFPPGRFVRLSDGRLARVSSAGRALDRPLLKLLPDGMTCDMAEPGAAHISITALVEEPAAIRELTEMQSRGEREVAELRLARSANQADSEGQVTTTEADDLRDACGHGDDCRLC